MLTKLKNHAKDFIQKLASDSKQASKAAFASFMILALFALTLDISPRIFPQALEGRILQPLKVSEKEALVKKLRDYSLLEGRIKECYVDGGEKGRIAYANEFLGNFEKSFSGILPGIGNLLLENPSTVTDRKEALVYEVMRNYAKKKFCIIEEEAWKPIYFSEYKSLISRMETYMQVRVVEEDKDKMGNVNEMFVGDFAKEYSIVEKDLKSTQEYVEDVIENAIESAIELDKWVENRLAVLGEKTTNKMLAINGEIAKYGVEVGNQIAENNASITKLNQRILEVLASFKKGEPTDKNTNVGEIKPSVRVDVKPPDLPGLTELPPSMQEAGKRITCGLLNLFTSKLQNNFLENRLPLNLALYASALANIDPFQPGVEDGLKEITQQKLERKDIKLHLCETLDNPNSEESTCFEKTK